MAFAHFPDHFPSQAFCSTTFKAFAVQNVSAMAICQYCVGPLKITTSHASGNTEGVFMTLRKFGHSPDFHRSIAFQYVVIGNHASLQYCFTQSTHWNQNCLSKSTFPPSHFWKILWKNGSIIVIVKNYCHLLSRRSNISSLLSSIIASYLSSYSSSVISQEFLLCCSFDILREYSFSFISMYACRRYILF